MTRVNDVTFTIHADSPFQEMCCIGVKDSSQCEAVGRWRDGEQRQRVAQLLFDATFDSCGNPAGIGLTGWRFNIADTEGGVNSEASLLLPTWEHYGLEDRRSYNLEAHAGRRWFLHAANRYGITSITACSDGPPAALFERREAAASVIASSSPSICSRYATFLNSLCLYYHAAGINFSHVSPLKSGFPGISEVFDHHTLGAFCEKLEEELQGSRLQTEVILPDCMTIDWLLRSYEAKSSGVEINIRDDFDRYLDLELAGGSGNCNNSSDFLRFFALTNKNKRVNTVSAASYLTCFPQGDRLVGIRERLARTLAGIRQKRSFSFCVSEYSLRLPTKDSRIPKELYKHPMTNDTTGIDAALWTARVLIMDLAVSGCSSWFYSDAVTDYKGNGLITINENTRDDDLDTSRYETTKMMWALGQFSFFIQPSMRRVKLVRSDGRVPRDVVEGLMSTSFIRKDRIVVVFVNMSLATTVAQLRVSGIEGVVEEASVFNTYITTRSASLAVQRSYSLGQAFQIPAKSILTCRGRIVRSGYLYFIISVGNTGTAIEGSADANTTVSLNPLSQSNPYQLWKIASCGLNRVAIINQVTGFSLTASHSKGFPLFQDSVQKSVSQYQMFTITGQPTPDLVICNPETSMALEGFGGVVKMVQRTGEPAQRWLIRAFDTPEQDLGHLHGIESESKKGPQRRNIKTPSEAELRNPPPRNYIAHDDPYDQIIDIPKLVDVPTTRPVQLSKYGRYTELYTSRRGKEGPEYPIAHQTMESEIPSEMQVQMPAKSLHSYFGNRLASEIHPPPPPPPSGPGSPSEAPMSPFGRQTITHPASSFEGPTTVASMPFSPTKLTTVQAPSQFTYDDIDSDDESHDAPEASFRPSRLPHPKATFTTTRRHGEVENWRNQNAALRVELQQQKEKAAQQQRDDDEKRKAQHFVEETRRKDKEEAESRAKRRGTSHLILNFAMSRKEFSSKYQIPLRTELAKSIGVKASSVILTYVGEDTKGIKVEVRLQDCDDVGTKLDKLYESVSAPEGNADYIDEDDVDETSSEGEKEVRNQESRFRKEFKAKREGKRKKNENKKKSSS